MANFLRNIFVKNSRLSVEQLVVKKTIISFFVFFVLCGAGIVAWKWLRQQPLDQGLQRPLRKALDKNEALFSQLLSEDHLTKEYAKIKAVAKARVNGYVGLSNGFNAAAWRMYVIRENGDTLKISLDDIKKLPKTEVVYNFKCIEGWSQITWWGGVRLADFIRSYHLEKEAAMQFIGLVTPDEKYYVGIDMRSALHPQTLLCYELNGRALPLEQGYPLRLIIPVKYGVKSIKRIGTMSFADERPKDYWAERGYDYFTGL